MSGVILELGLAMAKFTFNPLNVVLWDEELIRKSVFETNIEETIVVSESIEGWIVVECMNKPRDLLVHGVIWKEVK